MQHHIRVPMLLFQANHYPEQSKQLARKASNAALAKRRIAAGPALLAEATDAPPNRTRGRRNDERRRDGA